MGKPFEIDKAMGYDDVFLIKIVEPPAYEPLVDGIIDYKGRKYKVIKVDEITPTGAELQSWSLTVDKKIIETEE